jgi:hypothetical protein
MKRFDQSSLHSLIKHPQTDMSGRGTDSSSVLYQRASHTYIILTFRNLYSTYTVYESRKCILTVAAKTKTRHGLDFNTLPKS